MKCTDEQKAVIQGVTQIYGVPEALLIPIADNVLKLLSDLRPVNKTDEELLEALQMAVSILDSYNCAINYTKSYIYICTAIKNAQSK